QNSSQGQPVPAIQDVGDSYILNFPQPADGQGGMSLAQFVQACQQVTGLTFHVKDDAATRLTSTNVRLLGTKRIPKKQFYSFFQILMVMNDFVCTEIGPSGISVIQIDSLVGGGTQNAPKIRAAAPYVDPEDLDQYNDQPATLITTVINLPNTDVRSLSNTMRQLIADPNTQQMIPAGSSNSFVLTGFGSQVAALARMLKIIDDASAVTVIEPEFALIRLEFAAADEIASLVEELLDFSTQVSNRNAAQNPQGPTAPLSRGQGQVKIMVDPRQNSLLVLALPEDMPRIRDLVAQLDVDVVDSERAYHIYSVENVEASELAETLNSFLSDASRLEVQAGSPQTNNTASRGTNNSEFVVIADSKSNSLLIAASRTRYSEVLDLIRRLDQRQPQVLIETALIELTGQDIYDLGVELALANIPGVGQSGGFGVTNFGLSTLSDTDGDGIPDVRVPSTTTGVSAGLLDGDDFSLPVLLRALEENRNSNVLNVPSVLVNNNVEATVETKEEQPTTTITAVGGNAGQTQENFNSYQEAGITMKISPSISASNYLRLKVDLKISNFIGSVSGAIPPPRSTRILTTEVTVPDGDTMVIGGIIIDNRSETVDKIPILGDLPVLGTLFRRESNSGTRTTLYFFVTPHILDDTEFADLAEISYQRKMEAADTIGKERIRIIDPKFGSDHGMIDLDGFDIPLYQSPPRGETDAASIGMTPGQVQSAIDEAGE
ncbi:MAG TPA: secretin N-terminal domain-containing protein, partial [Planctomycetota bacterium]|nr:secretin N-terminal domain-containing protein [Planctomycetota bacterium]